MCEPSAGSRSRCSDFSPSGSPSWSRALYRWRHAAGMKTRRADVAERCCDREHRVAGLGERRAPMRCRHADPKRRRATSGPRDDGRWEPEAAVQPRYADGERRAADHSARDAATERRGADVRRRVDDILPRGRSNFVELSVKIAAGVGDGGAARCKWAASRILCGDEREPSARRCGRKGEPLFSRAAGAGER
jgi:hypothetical protein